MAMARNKWLTGFLFVLALGCATPKTASADPIPITTGFLTINWDGCCAGFSMQGPGFWMGVADNFHVGQHIGTLVPGTTVDLNYTLNVGGRGGAMVDGASVPNPDDPVGMNFKYFGGTLFFDTDPFLVEDRDPTATFVSFSTRFRMSGTVAGYRTWERTGEPLFNVAVTGQGSVFYTGFKRFDDGGRVTFAEIVSGKNYRFDELEAAPTPEPATMLLLGTGAGIVALRARRRRENAD